MKRLQLLACMLFLSLLTLGQGYPSLDLSANPDTIKIDGAEGYFALRYSARETLDKQTAIKQINDFLQQQSWTWLRVVDVIPDGSSLTGALVAQVQANETGAPRWCVFLSLLTNRPYFVYQYGPGVVPRMFTVGGNATIYPGKRTPVTLTGSEQGTTYKLYRGTTLKASLPGTGSPLCFWVMEAGNYTVEAGIQDYFVPMTGSVTVDRDNGVHYTSTENYVVETVYLDPTTTSATARTISDVTYLDGFGRPLQEIQVNGSPGGTGDIVKPYRYGVLGRVEREHVPYVLEGNHGGFVAGALSPSRWAMYGTGEAGYMYTLTGYDGSPLDRVVKRTGPGKSWHEARKGVTTSYHLNEANEVRLYRVRGTGELVQSGYYRAGSLQKVVTTDEDGNRVETYTDNQGRTVLEVTVESDNNRLETYSVHDDRGLLRYVLSPEASARVGTTANRATAAIRQFGYYYEHDRFGRLILKQLPGCDPVYLVYDKRDRLVLSQDGKQRAENADKWSYSLYDGQNRVVETGEVVITGTVKSHVALQGAATASDNYLPTGSRAPLQHTLYDSYTGTANVPVLPFEATGGYATGYHNLVTGLVTSVRTRVLGVNPVKWLTVTTYYDDRCRVIQTVSDNLEGGLSRVDMKYDFTGNVVRQRESHVVGGRTDVLETENTYDDRGRLLSSTVKLNNGSPATTSYTYDAVGRLVKKKHGRVEETMAYNTRGWLTSKESVPFKMKLRYENPSGGSVARWNGNISEWEWQHGTGVALMYGFAYDGVNRLTGTVQKQKSGTTWSALTGSYLEKGITYDRNGNIKTLQRTANGTTVDDLVYSYTGNQLTGLTENVRTSPTGDVYSPGSAAAGSYVYDKNGNMINDSRRALNLSYNVLNLLSEVKTGSTVKASYGYLADGTKLRVRDAGSNGFDYLGSLTYKSGSGGLQLESASFGDGVILTGTGGQEVNYFLTDHLGSVRVIVDGSGVVKERNDYYPFGARHVRGDYPQVATNRFKFNGKEEQVTENLEYLDYGARMYDTTLGRWFGIDLMSEEYYSEGTYNYCVNNPIICVDPVGMDVFMYFYVSGGCAVDDRLFWMGALTRAYDMLKNGTIGEGDIYRIQSISDLGMLGFEVDKIVKELSPAYGETREFGLWSHAALQGPMGSKTTSKGPIDDYQMTIEEWGKINFNWKNNGIDAQALFFGCRTAASVDDHGNPVIPWVQSISANENMKNVDVFGQTHRSWPSKLRNRGLTTSELRADIHNYPVYMVGSNKAFHARLQRKLGRLYYVYPMDVYQNGKYLRSRYQ